MAGNVQFILDADTAKAVSGFLRVVQSQQKSQKEFSKSVRSARRFDRNLGKLGRTAFRFGAGFVGAGIVTAGLQNFMRILDRAGSSTAAFEDEMTGLLSLGDNVNRIAELKDEVLGMSNAWGISRGQISATLFDLQSGTANLSDAIRDDLMRSGLELHKLTGAELPTSLKALIKTYQIYREELGTVATAQNKLVYLGEQGYLTFQEMANLLPDVLPAAKAMGASLDEVFAALVTATQYGGRTEKTFTGVRNVFLRMSNAEREGIRLTGDFTEKMRQLARLGSGDKMKRIFGDEAIAVASTLAERSGEVRNNLQAIANLPDDIVGRKLAKRMTDPSYRFAEGRKTTEAFVQNIEPIMATSDELREMLEYSNRWKRTRALVEQNMHPLLRAIPGRVTAQTQMAMWGATGEADLADALYIRDLRKSGRDDLADMYQLSRGEEYMGTSGKVTGEREAQRFADLRAEGYDLTLSKFMHLLYQEEHGNKEAAQALLRAAQNLEWRTNRNAHTE